MPLKRLKRKLTKENLWVYILTMLKEKPMYGYELQSKIKERFGFSIGKITSYVVLYKLKRAGYVKSKLEDSEEGRARRYYKITKKGRHLLTKGIVFIEETLEKIK